MNKTILTVIFLLTSLIGSAQNSLSLVYAPTDMRFGLRYDHVDKIGLYASGSYGNYKFDEFYVEDHVKLAAGAMFTSRQDFDKYASFTLGLSYHDYGVNNIKNQKSLKPLSFEIGASAVISKFIAGFTFDPNKWEGEIFFGIRL